VKTYFARALYTVPLGFLAIACTQSVLATNRDSGPDAQGAQEDATITGGGPTSCQKVPPQQNCPVEPPTLPTGQWLDACPATCTWPDHTGCETFCNCSYDINCAKAGFCMKRCPDAGVDADSSSAPTDAA
jgi:hypothetical protein